MTAFVTADPPLLPLTGTCSVAMIDVGSTDQAEREWFVRAGEVLLEEAKESK